jgi:hypothetical protein
MPCYRPSIPVLCWVYSVFCTPGRGSKPISWASLSVKSLSMPTFDGYPAAVQSLSIQSFSSGGTSKTNLAFAVMMYHPPLTHMVSRDGMTCQCHHASTTPASRASTSLASTSPVPAWVYNVSTQSIYFAPHQDQHASFSFPDVLRATRQDHAPSTTRQDHTPRARTTQRQDHLVSRQHHTSTQHQQASITRQDHAPAFFRVVNFGG